MTGEDRDVQAYLARIRKTIADSRSLVSQAELRMAETDRMLERQGLTREQVMNMRFTEAQREAVNRELVRRGMEPLEDDGNWGDASRETRDGGWVDMGQETRDAASSDELAERQRKFGMMMKPFQI